MKKLFDDLLARAQTRPFWIMVIGGILLYAPEFWTGVLGLDSMDAQFQKFTHGLGLLLAMLGGVQQEKIGMARSAMQGEIAKTQCAFMAVILALLVGLTSCSGLSPVILPGGERAATPLTGDLSAQCTSIESRYELWGALALGSGALQLGQLGQLLHDDQSVRDALVIGGVIDVVVGTVFLWLRDQVTSEWIRAGCGAPLAKVAQ